MGITARGAWESVKRHFREMGVDTQTTDFTVAGIGDMSGDVFGNGMLLSRHIKLVAAFDHRHIFLDPDPDVAASFAERERMFKLPRSSWADYDAKLISAGGGIHARSAKSIALTPQVKAVLGITADALAPIELVNAILKAPVDLIYNGGIGTYVKAQSETHAQVGDRANDALRVNGRELRCKVFAEGGNLGCTQLGRIEYALAGGRINTDAIDNSAGVDTSDHEVNIKILLGLPITEGELTEKQRNALLVGDDRRRRRAGSSRQLLPDAGALGHRPHRAATARCAAALHPVSRKSREAQSRAGVPAVRRRDLRAARARHRTDQPRARGHARLQQDLALRRAARVDAARRSLGRNGAVAILSRRRCASATRRTWSAIRSSARSSPRTSPTA